MKVGEANAIVVPPEGFCPSPDLLPVVPESITDVDPVDYMATVLNRAKGWLVEAQSIEAVRDAKAVALGYETVIREKELAFDAQLSATEIVRRCERRIGQLVHEGQERGEIAKRGDIGASQAGALNAGHLLRPGEVIGSASKQAVTETYTMADTPDEDFDEAIEEAKAEGNLSRANVVRKVKGETKPSAPMPAGMRRSPSVPLARQLPHAAEEIAVVIRVAAELRWEDADEETCSAVGAVLRSSRTLLHRIITRVDGATK